MTNLFISNNQAQPSQMLHLIKQNLWGDVRDDSWNSWKYVISFTDSLEKFQGVFFLWQLWQKAKSGAFTETVHTVRQHGMSS